MNVDNSDWGEYHLVDKHLVTLRESLLAELDANTPVGPSTLAERNIQQAIERFVADKGHGAIQTDVDLQLALSNCLRQITLEIVDASTAYKQRFLDILATLMVLDLIPAGCVIAVVQDCLECSTLEESQELFCFLERNIRHLKTCKNTLLTVCNGLLRRLSGVLHADFRGRILMYLARFFPLTEKSGANVTGAFNTELAVADADADVKEEESRTSTPIPTDVIDVGMDVDNEDNAIVDKQEESSPFGAGYDVIDSTGCLGNDKSSQGGTDFNLYRKYSEFQKFCLKPALVYSDGGFDSFMGSVDTLATTFEGDRLELKKTQRKPSNDSCTPPPPKELEYETSETYNPKFTTSPRLINLQLTDPNFRLMVLKESLIIFHHLLLPKDLFRRAEYKLTDDQRDALKTATIRVYAIIKDTPPTGEYVARCMRRILDNELYWVEWKNQRCPPEPFQPSLALTPAKNATVMASIGSKKRKAFVPGETVHAKSVLSSCIVSVNELWAHLAKDKQELPNHFVGMADEKIFENFIAEGVEQCDPRLGLDMEYRLVNDPWWWRLALRICEKHSVRYKYQIAKYPGSSQNGLVLLLEDLWKERNPELSKQLAEEKAIKDAERARFIAEMEAEEAAEELAKTFTQKNEEEDNNNPSTKSETTTMDVDDGSDVEKVNKKAKTVDVSMNGNALNEGDSVGTAASDSQPASPTNGKRKLSETDTNERDDTLARGGNVKQTKQSDKRGNEITESKIAQTGGAGVDVKSKPKGVSEDGASQGDFIRSKTVVSMDKASMHEEMTKRSSASSTTNGISSIDEKIDVNKGRIEGKTITPILERTASKGEVSAQSHGSGQTTKLTSLSNRSKLMDDEAIVKNVSIRRDEGMDQDARTKTSRDARSSRDRRPSEGDVAQEVAGGSRIESQTS
eukprot:CFRG5550T1